jgi:hypothetical protein
MHRHDSTPFRTLDTTLVRGVVARRATLVKLVALFNAVPANWAQIDKSGG